MQPIKFPQQNFVFTKPEGWNEDECKDLPAFKGRDANGLPVIISKWALSTAEIAKINETGAVYLLIVGDTTPPASLHIDSPFINDEPTAETEERQITIAINLRMTEQDTFVNMTTGGVPRSLILEALSNLTKSMAEELVKEALEEVPDEAVEAYLEGRLKTDREKLAEQLRQPTKTKGKIIRLGGRNA